MKAGDDDDCNDGNEVITTAMSVPVTHILRLIQKLQTFGSIIGFANMAV